MNYVAIMYLHAIINRIQCFHDNKTWVRNFLTVRRQIPGQPEPQVSPAASRAQWSGGVFGPWPCYWASSDPTSSSSGPHPLMSTSICQQFGKLMIHLEESMHFYWVKRTKKSLNIWFILWSFTWNSSFFFPLINTASIVCRKQLMTQKSICFNAKSAKKICSLHIWEQKRIFNLNREKQSLTQTNKAQYSSYSFSILHFLFILIQLISCFLT